MSLIEQDYQLLRTFKKYRHWLKCNNCHSFEVNYLWKCSAAHLSCLCRQCLFELKDDGCPYQPETKLQLQKTSTSPSHPDRCTGRIISMMDKDNDEKECSFEQTKQSILKVDCGTCKKTRFIDVRRCDSCTTFNCNSCLVECDNYHEVCPGCQNKCSVCEKN